ncbi:hypothetical protein Tco_1318307 [Tanacetum coccineum]
MEFHVEFRVELPRKGRRCNAKSTVRGSEELGSTYDTFRYDCLKDWQKGIVKQRRVRAMSSDYPVQVLKDKILGYFNETSKVKNAPQEMLRDLDQPMEKRPNDVILLIKWYSEYEYEIRYHPGKANVVTDALSRKGPSDNQACSSDGYDYLVWSKRNDTNSLK